MRWLSALAILTVVSGSVSGDEISVIGWNGNGGRRDYAPIAAARHDLYAMIDVRVSAVDTIVEAAKRAKVLLDNRFEFLGETGGSVLWDAQKFDVVEDMRPERSRDHLAMKFKQLSTGAEFWVVLVDFDRRCDESRKHAESLDLWMKNQTSPVLIFGNLGFDIDLNQFPVNPGWEPDHPAFTRLKTSGLHWVRPPRLEHLPAAVETLDYVALVSDSLRAWNPVASIENEDGSHPPMRIVFTTSDRSATNGK
jgi:hypothetical protein